MTSRHQLDNLGNPVYRPTPDWQHRLIRWASVITIAACLGILVWGR